MGSLIKGKRAFVAMKLVGGSFFNHQRLIEEMRGEQKYEPCPSDKVYTETVVMPDSKLPEDFSREFNNLAGGDFFLFDLLCQERKADPEVIKRRTKAELSSQISMMKQSNKDWKPSSQFKSEIKNSVKEQENLKADPKLTRIPVAFNIQSGMVLIGTKSEKAIQKIALFITRFLVGLSDSEQNLKTHSPSLVMPALELFSADLKGLGPLLFHPDMADYAEDASAYAKQWLTWITARSAINTLRLCAGQEIDEKEPILAGWVKLDLRDIDGEIASTFKVATALANSTSGTEGLENIADYCLARIQEGVLVEEVSLRLPLDVFGSEDKRTYAKIGFPFFLSDVDVAFPKDPEDDSDDNDLIDFILEGCVKLGHWVSEDSEKFTKDRLDQKNWAEQMAKVRDAVSSSIKAKTA